MAEAEPCIGHPSTSVSCRVLAGQRFTGCTTARKGSGQLLRLPRRAPPAPLHTAASWQSQDLTLEPCAESLRGLPPSLKRGPTPHPASPAGPGTSWSSPPGPQDFQMHPANDRLDIGLLSVVWLCVEDGDVWHSPSRSSAGCFTGRRCIRRFACA